MIALLAVLITAVWVGSVVHLDIEAQWHHYWLGLALLLLGAWLGWWWCIWFGLVVMADDAVQHLIQCWRPAYRSPLHRLYAVTLYRWTHS